MSKSSKIANEIANQCKELGWTFKVERDLLRIYKEIKPNNRDDFVQADGEYYSILSLLPESRLGSIWGTDGGGVGALSAMKNGLFVMNKSGGNKHILRALEKIV